MLIVATTAVVREIVTFWKVLFCFSGNI